MTILAFVVANWRWGLMGLIVAAVGILAWQANEWRHRAGEADKLKIALEAHQQRERVADRARIQASDDLEAERRKTHTQIVEVIKHVPTYIDLGKCTLSVDGLRALNDARGVPRPARGTAGDAFIARADP